MIHALSPEGAEAVRAAARAGAPVALDFDGTLAPIVPDPRDAALPPSTRTLLAALAARVPCAVVSGRARADVAGRLAGIPLRAVAGNHGAETGAGVAGAPVRAQVGPWVAALRDGLRLPGVEIEDKGFTVAVHWRRSADPEAARREVLRLARSLPRARVTEGKAVVDLAPAGAPTKAAAVEAFAARFPGPLVYAGDDETDEDALRSPAVAVGIRVGRGARSAARYHLVDQGEVDLLLALILEAAGGG